MLRHPTGAMVAVETLTQNPHKILPATIPIRMNPRQSLRMVPRTILRTSPPTRMILQPSPQATLLATPRAAIRKLSQLAAIHAVFKQMIDAGERVSRDVQPVQTTWNVSFSTKASHSVTPKIHQGLDLHEIGWSDCKPKGFALRVRRGFAEVLKL